jgi:hypothetical protein
MTGKSRIMGNLCHGRCRPGDSREEKKEEKIMGKIGRK